MREWETSIGPPYVDEHISMDRCLAAKSKKSVFSGVSGYISSQDGLSSGFTLGTQTQSPGRGTSAPFRARIMEEDGSSTGPVVKVFGTVERNHALRET